MPVIEGVGDEVLVVVGLFFLLCVVLLAWFSTHTRDIPFVSVIVVELSQRRQRNANNEDNNAQDEADGADGEPAETAPSEADVADKELAGSNNNADRAEDGGEESMSAAASKNVEDVASPSVPESGTKPAGAKSPKPSSGVCDLTEEAGEGSGPVPAEAVSLIPGFRPLRESGEEVRRRRVAYFDGGSGPGGGAAAQKDDVPSGTTPVTEDSLVKDSAEVTETSFHRLGSCHTAPSSDTSPASKSKGHASSSASSSPVAASTSTTQTAEPPPPDLLPSQSEASPSPQTAASVAEGLPGDTDTGEQTSSPVTAESTTKCESPGPTGPGEGLGEGAPAAGEVNDRVGGSSAESLDAGGQQIRVRLKYLNDTQRLVYADPLETVGNFRRLHFSSELEDNKIVRFIFNGQDLRNDLSTLQAYNIADNSVVHCLITQNRQQNEASARARANNGHEDDPQMGALLFPVFGIVLGLVWYLRFSYKQYFNAMSTVSLAGISFIYVLAFFSSVRHRRQPHQHLE